MLDNTSIGLSDRKCCELFANVNSFTIHTGKKNLPASARDTRKAGWTPGWGRFPGEGNGNPLQYSSWRIPWTEEPGRLQSMGLQRWTHLKQLCMKYIHTRTL